jgi:hypothetical protein
VHAGEVATEDSDGFQLDAAEEENGARSKYSICAVVFLDIQAFTTLLPISKL